MAAGQTNYWIGTSGVKLWTTTGNWSLGTIPVDGEHLVFRNSTSLIEDNTGSALNQSAVQPASMVVEGTFTGALGDDVTPLQIGPLVWRVEGGVTRFNVDFGTNPFVGLIAGSGESLDTNQHAIRIDGDNGSNVLSITGGDVGLGTNTPADAGEVNTVNVSGGSLEIGSGIICGTGNIKDGSLLTNGNLTVLSITGGEATTQGIATVDDVNALGGTYRPHHRPAAGAMVTNLNLRGGTVDFSGNPVVGTVSNTQLKSGTIIQFSATQITHTNPSIDFDENGTFTCGVSQ